MRVTVDGDPRMWTVCVAVLLLTTQANSASNKYGKFWHVTDFHYDHTYQSSQLSCNEQVDDLAPLGNYWCDSPWKLVTAAIKAMNDIEPDVDFVLWTGDTVAHISNDNLNITINMDLMENVTNALNTTFFPTPIYSAFGNHDYYPASQFPATTSIIYNRTADMWRGWIGDEEQMRNFRKGGYYTRLLPTNQKLRMVILNTNLYYTSDKATPGIQDPTDQLQWLRTLLTQARTDGEKVIVAAHIPPGIHTPRGVQWYQQEFVQPVMSVLQDFADIIKAMHFGHDHYDGFKVLFNNQSEAVVPLFVAPSVTPWRFKLKPDMVGDAHNPAIRLVTYDPDTGDHLNILQYYLDLPAYSKSDSVANFTLLYNFTENYQVSNISAASLASLVLRMWNQTTGDALLDDYFRFSLVGAAHPTGCNRTCKDRIWCGFRHFNLSDFEKCAETLRNASGCTDDYCHASNRDTGEGHRLSPPVTLVIIFAIALFLLFK